VLQRIRDLRKKDDGFTLVELLIVIIILGVLAGIVVFSVQAFQNRGETAACKADFKSVETALEAYYAQNSDYPATDDGNPATKTDGLQGLVTGGYLKEVPSSPKYTITYARVAGPPVSYTLVAANACNDQIPAA
jgi:general secretion pathway protein G